MSGNVKTENVSADIVEIIVTDLDSIKGKGQQVLNHVISKPEEEGQVSFEVNQEVVSVESSDYDKLQKSKPIAPWKLFRFADFWDVLMIISGFISAVVSGVILPVHVILFGNIINTALYYGVATNDIGRPSFSEIIQNLSTLANVSCDMYVQESRDLILNLTDFSMLLCDEDGQQEMNFFNSVLNYVCDPDGTLREEIGMFSMIYIGMATAVLIVIFLSTIFWNVSAYRQTRRIRQAFYHSILHQEVGWFDVTKASELNTRLADDVEKIQAGIGSKVTLFLNYVSTFVSGFTIAFIVHWKMALVVSVILPILTLMIVVITKIVATFTVREQTAYAAAGAVAEEVLSSIRTVVAFGGEEREVQRYDQQLVKAKKEGIKRGLFTSLIVGVLYFVSFSTYALAFWYGSTLIIDCELFAGDVTTVLFCITLGSSYLVHALPELETFAIAVGAATDIFKTIDRKPLMDPSSDEGESLEKLEGNIKFSDVGFCYPARPDVQVLETFDLEIPCGQTVALVGPSGCGKSTVIQLFQQFYIPNGGQITLDGHEISTLNLKWLRRSIGVVSQEPVLFETTIAENIRYGRENATLEDIQQAAREANAHEFISQLPEGYDTDVGEGGTQLSGGQKQRIAIARALVRDPKVLLLDEATSALDNESERVVQDALDKARKGRTTIIVAHRLSTIQNADTIAYIENGRVAEKGTHSELMEHKGLYYELVTAQTIEEEEEEVQPSDGLTSFKVALKRSFSLRSAGSYSSCGRPVHSKRVSIVSNHFSGGDPTADRFSLFSFENLPFAYSPSPYPWNHSYPQEEEMVTYDDDQQGEAGVLEGEEREEPVHTEDDEEAVARKNLRPSTLRRMMRRRHKIPDADLQATREVTFKELLALNKPDWPLIVVGVGLSAVVGAIAPIIAVLFSDTLRIFGLTRAEIEQGVKEVSGGFVGLAVFYGLVYFFASFALSVSGERLTKRLRYESFQTMLKQDIGWFDKNIQSTGALTTRLASDAAEVKRATGIRLGVTLQTVFSLIAALIISFEASWELSLVMLVAFPIICSSLYIQTRLLAGRARKNKKRLERSGKTAVEGIHSIRTVAGLGVEEKFFNIYKNLLSAPFKDNIKSVFMEALVLSLSESIVYYLFAAGFSFAAFLVIEKRGTYDDMFQVFAAIVVTSHALGRASSFASDATKAKISAMRILALLDRKPHIDVTSADGLKIENPSGDIAIKSVHFNYPARPDDKVLQGISISVKPGQTLALVGPSGCGKSTVGLLLERFYDPVLGSLMLEGNDLRDLNLQWLRTQIGIVSQEPVLFDASISENIQYGALFRDVSDEEIVEAAKSANIHSFIQNLPQGYNTNVGAKGTQLSGGQKQRIAIARALVRDPKVLLLDEATSALDTESERVVQEALDKAQEGRTSIVIAHRLSTIYKSDVIAVIHDGQVIESGTHSELMALKGAYYLLNTVQDIENLD